MQTNPQVQLTVVATYEDGPHAIFEGELVRVIGQGDAEGMSPVSQVVDATGKSGWVPASKVRIIDPRFLPNDQYASLAASYRDTDVQHTASFKGR